MAPDDKDRDVLSSLPRTRPQRRSAKRDRPVKAPSKAARPSEAPAKRRASRTAPPTPRAKAPASPGAKAAASPRAQPRPRRRMPPAGFAPPRDEREQAPPSGVELVGTAIQAAGELTQIGLAVGAHALRSALGRLSRDD